MERGYQKSKELLYSTKLKCIVIQHTEEKGNCIVAAIFGVESNVRLWWKHKAVISGCEASQKKFTRPKRR
jgi:hypothetical protein